MKEKTKIRSVVIHDDMISAVEKHFDGSIGLFIRESCAEKLARDFGVIFPADVVRLKQGKRTDLKENPEKKAALQEQAAKMREHRWKKE